MIVRYEIGFTLDGWYQNTEAFHHLQDAINEANNLVSEGIDRAAISITEQHFRNEEDHLKRDNIRRTKELTLDEAAELLRDQKQSPDPFIPDPARYAVSSAEFLTLLDAGNRHLTTIHKDAAPHDATIRHIIKRWTMYPHDAAIASCPICGEVCGQGVLIDPPSGCRYGFCRNMKQSYDMYQREGTSQDLTSEQLQTLIFQASEEATIVLLQESQNPEYSTTIGAFIGEAVEDVVGTLEDIDTTDQLTARGADIGADIMKLLLYRVKHEFLPTWWEDVIAGSVSKHVNKSERQAA